MVICSNGHWFKRSFVEIPMSNAPRDQITLESAKHVELNSALIGIHQNMLNIIQHCLTLTQPINLALFSVSISVSCLVIYSL